MNHFTTQKKHFFNSIKIASLMVFVLVVFYVMEHVFGVDLHTLGILPRTPSNWYGIITHVFIHGDLTHLIDNSIPLFILTATLFYFYEKIADIVFILLWIFTGILLWLMGRDDWHIGASGLIYALAAFLFVGGILRRHIPLLAVSLMVVFLYGNMIWHVFPWQQDDPVSWEGHLSGSIAGVIISLAFYKYGPQRTVKEWHEEQDTEDQKDLAKYAESFELEGDEDQYKAKTEEPEEKLEQEKDINGFRQSEFF